MGQQQQSNMVAPQKVGGKKKGMKVGKKKSLPSYNKVAKSVAKTMGY